MKNLEINAWESGVNDCLIKDSRETFLKRLPIVVRRVFLNFHNCIIRKKAENALRETREKFLEAFMLSPNAVIISLRPEGQVIDVNEAAEKGFGMPREKMIGKTLIALGIIKTEDADNIMKNSMKNGSYHNLEIKLYTAGGEERICLLSGHTIAMGGKECIIQAVNDITLQKKIQEEALRNKNLESIGILAGGIARDFNNLLTSIMGNISIAKMSLHNTEKIHRALNRAEENSIKAADLAGKLLTFSEGGEPIYQKNDITDIVRNVIDLHFRNTHVTFNYPKGSGIWPVSGDETQLSQVIYNILLNAVQAFPNEAKKKKDGKVIIKEENISIPKQNDFSLTAGEYVKISIIDNGIGIPAENLGKIFTPFFSTKDTITHQGVGLGLSISQSVIKKHRGTITVNSTAGKGTTATLVIPAFKEELS
jgi:PAS domain S-box-containing protein